MTSSLCALGRGAADRTLRRWYGAARPLPGGIGLFGCAVAPSPAALILPAHCRVPQAGSFIRSGQAILLDLHPLQRHGGVLAIWAV